MPTRILRVCLAAALALALSACATTAQKTQDLLSQGDYVGAIETLAKGLAEKPNDKDAVELFASVYPSHPLKLIMTADELSASAGGDTSAAERLVTAFDDLVRIQNAIMGMPAAIGDAKKSPVEVKKLEGDFKARLEAAKKTAAGTFYAEAAKTYPGADKGEKEAILRLLVKVVGYAPDYKDAKDRGARLCYDIASGLEKGETVSELQSAVEWYQNAQKWIAGYKDTASKIQTTSYSVGSRLKEDGTVPSYDKAYAYFKLAGSYKNAPGEVQVYEFYKKVLALTNESRAGSGNYLKTSASASGNRLDVVYEKRSMSTPFVRKAAVKAESSAFSIFNPKSDVVFIGAIVDGKSIADETFKPILASRAPMDITIDLPTIKGSPTVTIADPSKYSAAQQAIKKLVNAGTDGTIPVRAEYRYVDVKSSEMLNLALGVGVGKGDISIQSNTSLDKETSRSSTLVELTQVYYTVNIDIPSKAADFFATSGGNIVSTDLLGSTTPYYVSSVTYGRRAYFLVESDASSQTIQQSIEFAKEKSEGVPLSTSVKVDASVKNTFASSRTTIKSHVLGGGGAGAAITSLDGMMQWIHDGMDGSKNLGTAVPIGFVMRSLKDNGIAVVEQAGSLTSPAKAKVTVTPVGIQIDYGNNPKSLVRLYISGGSRMKPDNASSDPNIGNDGKGWLVAMNNGDNYLPIGDSQKGMRFALNARSYDTLVSSGDERIYIGGNLGDRTEQTVLGKSIGKNAWAGFRSTNLTVDDILQQTPAYQALVNEGWAFRGPDFQGRYFFRFDVELFDE
ncbi:MAG: thiol-activated cytolysin family protein [Spirochaetes bacterium]|nr:thiol-activated cytolysin family protein [Spirochaetota bacterium]MBU1081551.1 thiol-activated cytolysin family protein [Spirochaetota bacterium]